MLLKSVVDGETTGLFGICGVKISRNQPDRFTRYAYRVSYGIVQPENTMRCSRVHQQTYELTAVVEELRELQNERATGA